MKAMKVIDKLNTLGFILLLSIMTACSGDSLIQDINVEVSASTNVSSLSIVVQADGIGQNFTVQDGKPWVQKFSKVQILTVSATGYTTDDREGFILIKLKDRDNPERVVRGSGKDIRCSITYP